MGTLRDAFKDGRIAGGVVAVGIIAAVGAGTFALATSAASEQPAAMVETAAPALSFDLAGTTDNGLAVEQEADAAAAEQARLAAEAEAARVAAEQAAAAEAARIAAEQAASAERTADEPAADEPVEEDPWAGRTPVPFIVDPNPENAAGGFYDVSQCPSGSASTGPDGVPYCD